MQRENEKHYSKLGFATLALAFALTAGCGATVEQLEEVRDLAVQARQDAQDAQGTADEALKKAEKAQRCCDDNTKKLQMMFKRSMRK